MEAWQLQREFYESQGRLADQSFEAKLGRRILRGLGHTEKRIHHVERNVFGAVFADKPLWVRASQLFLELLGRTQQWGHLVKSWHLEPVQVSKYDDILARFELFELGEGKSPVFFTLQKSGKDDGKVFTVWDANTTLNYLQPPYRVMDNKAVPGMCVVAQDIVHFVSQFGPYEYSGEA